MADELFVAIEHHFPPNLTIAAEFPVSTRGGTVTVLFGPSGSGKTTVVRAIAGLTRPTRGSIRFDGETWFDAEASIFVEPQRRRVGYVFQEAALFPHLTVRGNVEFGLARLSSPDRTTRVAQMLDLVGLREHADRYAGELSGGQAQRVALARALAPHPRLLLLDEPFGSLDTPSRMELRRLLRASIEQLGLAALLVTHDRSEAIALGDRIALLVEGRVRQVGPVLDVFRRPADLLVARSVGVESVVPGRLERVSDGLVNVRVGDAVLRVVDVERAGGPQEVFACIRAEDVTLTRLAAPTASARNHLPGRIVSIASEGVLEHVTIDCGFPLAALITRDAREELALQEGNSVIAAIKATAIHLVPRA
jgi:molybdate transport system ATP-binding protein